MSRAPLTDAALRKLKPSPKRGLTEKADGGCRGLVFRLTPNGVASFGFRYRDRITGRDERLALGRYPSLSLKDARQKANALRSEIDGGKNPAAHKRSASDRTFAGLAERYMTEHAKRFKKSWAGDDLNLNKHILPHWADRDITGIQRSDVIRLIERIIADGSPVQANRVQALISKIFSFALDADLVTANPCSRLKKRSKETARSRTLTDAEIRTFWKAAVAPPVSRAVGLALRLVLVLGLRSGEVAGMARKELEFDKRGVPMNWTIPAERTKNSRAHFVPLSPLARDLIVEALQLSTSSEFVFPSPINGGPIEAHAMATAMQRLGRGQLVEPRLRAHDLRRTCATRLSAAGVAAEDIAAILNHRRADVTGRHYDHYQRAEEKRAALQRWSRILSGIIEGKPSSAKVVALRG